MVNITTQLDAVLMKKVITRIYLRYDVEATLDNLLYFPMMRNIVSGLKDTLKNNMK